MHDECLGDANIVCALKAVKPGPIIVELKLVVVDESMGKLIPFFLC